MVASSVTDVDLILRQLDKDRAGVIWGSGIGGLETFQIEMLNFAEMVRQNLTFLIPKMISDIACGHISIKYGFRGPNFATVSACASSTNAIIAFIILERTCRCHGNWRF
jgi:3-oxoacyl-[acyl-carrier-protein] synthase II